MQSRQQTNRKETERKGLAVPIALLALLVVGVLVTGVFYLLSHEPDHASAGKVSVGRTVAPGPWLGGLRDSLSADSLSEDSLSIRGDTSASGPSGGPVPLSGNPVDTVSRLRPAPEHMTTPENGASPKAAIPRVDPLH